MPKAVAQNKIMTVGLEAGGNLSNQYGNSILNEVSKAKFGASGGVALQFNFSDKLALRTGAMFERKGSRDDYEINIPNGGQTITDRVQIAYNFDYVTIPLLFRVTFGKTVKVFANAGPYLGILINQETITEAGLLIKNNRVDNARFFESTDFGMTGGLGAGLPIGKNSMLSLEVRHSQGLANISVLPVFGGGLIANTSTSALLGLSFNFIQRKRLPGF